MGRSITGKELGKGITQRKSDKIYQGRFVNRFGKTRSVISAEVVNTSLKCMIPKLKTEEERYR